MVEVGVVELVVAAVKDSNEDEVGREDVDGGVVEVVGILATACLWELVGVEEVGLAVVVGVRVVLGVVVTTTVGLEDTTAAALRVFVSVSST